MIFPSIEQRAQRISDSALKLRFLRLQAEQARARHHFWSERWTKRSAILFLPLLSLTMIGIIASRKDKSATRAASVGLPHEQVASAPSESVWLVETRDTYALYSNGLQIQTGYVTSSEPRRYRTWTRALGVREPELHVPAGIVFHTTESLVVPLQPSHRHSLVDAREDTLQHVRRDRLYNFLIDRLGQVFRIVPEEQVAFHAGHSVWADAEAVYYNLNESFLGVSFEASNDAAFQPTAAQIRSGRLLTEILRSLYRIPETNCVTHAQVSLNPGNFRIGYHTDWAARFPFRELGLTTGYGAALPAIELFGFRYDQTFLQAIGGRPWEGILSSEKRLEQTARSQGMALESYRTLLNNRFHQFRSHSHERTGSSRA